MVARRLNDTRLNSDQSSRVRADRRMDERSVTQDRKLSDDERVEEFQQQFFQSALPDLPKIKGYHVCWLTTENPRDPIHARIRQGYEPIKESDIAGWTHAALRTGEWAGCIGVNEMIAFKLPLHLYEAYMRHNHHEQPLEQEEMLNSARRKAEAEANSIAKSHVSFQVEEGTAELGKAPEPPPFAVTAGEMTQDDY